MEEYGELQHDTKTIKVFYGGAPIHCKWTLDFAVSRRILNVAFAFLTIFFLARNRGELVACLALTLFSPGWSPYVKLIVLEEMFVL